MNNDFSSYFEQEEFKEELAKYEEMTANQQSTYFDADQISDIAEYYASVNEYGKAFDAIEYALKLHPDETELITLKGHLLIELKRITEAEQLLESFPDALAYEAKFLKARILASKGRFEETEQILQEMMQNSEKDEYESYLDAAYLYSDGFFYKEALPWFEKALKLSSEDKEVIKDYTECCIFAEEYEKVVKLCNRMLDQDPYSYDYWFMLGKAYYTAKEYNKALEAYDFVLTINPEHLGTILMKAHCYFKLENYEEAAKYYLQYSETDKESEISLFFVGLCYFWLEKYEAALEAFLASLSRERVFSSELVETYTYIANCYFKLGNSPKALEYIDLAIETDQEDSTSHIAKGTFLANEGKYEEAKEVFTKIIELDKKDFLGDPSIYTDIATIYIQHQMFDIAEETLKILENRFPGFEETDMYLAYLYLIIQDKNNFQIYFNRAVQLHPESVEHFLETFPVKNPQIVELIRDLKKVLEQDLFNK